MSQEAQRPKWKRFEDLAVTIQRALAPGARVEQNVYVAGRLSGVDRQIDIGVWTRVGQYELFIAIDCKDYGDRLDVKDVETFIGLVKDVGANKGAMVSAQGYSDAAKKVAEAAGLSLYTLVDAESEDWPSVVSIPCVVEESAIVSYGFQISSTELTELDAGDISMTAVFRADGSRIGPLRDLLFQRWNEAEVPYAPGEHKGIRLGTEATYFQQPDGQLARVELEAYMRVGNTLHFGQLPLEKVQGFRDDLKGSLITRSITTGMIDFDTIRDTWQEVPSEEALAVKPVMWFRLATHYLLEGEELDEAPVTPVRPPESSSGEQP